jgi:hypothetical protein
MFVKKRQPVECVFCITLPLPLFLPMKREREEGEGRKSAMWKKQPDPWKKQGNPWKSYAPFRCRAAWEINHLGDL